MGLEMTDRAPSDPRLEEAMDWLLRLREAPDDPGLRRRVEAWVAAAPDHRRAWDRARETWQTLGEVPPATIASWDRPPAAATEPEPTSTAPAPGIARAARRPRRSRTPRRRRMGLAVAALATAACLALVFAPALLLHLQADHVTAAAEMRRITLEDGSVVQLAPESAIDLRFTAERRAVTLLAGDAFFDVTPDARSPFVVEAEDLRVRAIGTAFGVGLSGRAISVEVVSGIVGVNSEGARSGGALPLDERLDRGQALRFDRATRAVALERKPPGDLATWRQGTLLVVDASIAEVVETLRRYRSGWIVIADDRLAAQRVNGLYDLRNPDGALRALVHPAGGQVHEITPLLRVLR